MHSESLLILVRREKLSLYKLFRGRWNRSVTVVKPENVKINSLSKRLQSFKKQRLCVVAHACPSTWELRGGLWESSACLLTSRAPLTTICSLPTRMQGFCDFHTCQWIFLLLKGLKEGLWILHAGIKFEYDLFVRFFSSCDSSSSLFIDFFFVLFCFNPIWYLGSTFKARNFTGKFHCELSISPGLRGLQFLGVTSKALE